MNDIDNNFNNIKKLSILLNKLFELNNLFESNLPNNISNPIEIFYIFSRESANGFIEYKRTLLSYKNIKIDKLLRQIYWRIYEGLVTTNTKMCYYIIGLDDSGILSNIPYIELEQSLDIIKDAIANTYIKLNYLYLKNTFDNGIILVVCLLLDVENDGIEYFQFKIIKKLFC